MVKKSSAKQRYLELEKVRVSYDHKLDKIHLTAKDPDMPEGFHLTLNSGRDAEQSLRRLLTEYKLIRETEALVLSTTPIGAKLFPYATSANETLVWDFTKSGSGSVVGQPGRVTILENLVKHCHRYADSWDITAVNIRNKTLRTQVKEYPELITSHATTIAQAFHAINSFALLVRERKIRVEEEDVERYEDLNLPDKTPLLIIDDIQALLDTEPVFSHDIDYMNDLRKKIDRRLEYIFENHKIAGVKLVTASRDRYVEGSTAFASYHYRFGMKITLGSEANSYVIGPEKKFGDPAQGFLLGHVDEHRNNMKDIVGLL